MEILKLKILTLQYKNSVDEFNSTVEGNEGKEINELSDITIEITQSD